MAGRKVSRRRNRRYEDRNDYSKNMGYQDAMAGEILERLGMEGCL
jgi:hypothetical protein